jgi:S1-C subfamily serine protease
VGQTVSLIFLRDVNGKLERRSVDVTLAERPDFFARDAEAAPKEKDTKPKAGSTRLGLTLAEFTPQLVTERHLNGVKGLFIKEVDPNGLAADVKPQPITTGEVVTRINRVPINTLADFQRVIDSLKAGDPIVLNLSRYDRAEDRILQRIVQFTYQ